VRGELLDPRMAQECNKLDILAERYTGALMAPSLGRLESALLMADAISKLRELITPAIMERVMSLMNSPLGFKTDRPNKKNARPYSSEEVRECFIASLLNGVWPVGNEWNIISGNMYIAQNGYRRKVSEVPGLTDLHLSPGVPGLHNGRQVVRYAATWKLNGVSDELLGPDGKPGRVIPVAHDDYSSVDQLLGKAERKALKAIWHQIHGSDHTPPDGEVGESLTEQTKVESQVEKAPPAIQQVVVKSNQASKRQLSEMAALVDQCELSSDQFAGFLAEYDNCQDPARLTYQQAEELIAFLRSHRQGLSAMDAAEE